MKCFREMRFCRLAITNLLLLLQHTHTHTHTHTHKRMSRQRKNTLYIFEWSYKTKQAGGGGVNCFHFSSRHMSTNTYLNVVSILSRIIHLIPVDIDHMIFDISNTNCLIFLGQFTQHLLFVSGWFDYNKASNCCNYVNNSVFEFCI